MGAASALLITSVIGCESNPASTDGDDDPCGGFEHIDADGLVVERVMGRSSSGAGGATVLVSQWEGEVTGELEVLEGRIESGLRVTFLDEDSTRITIPSDCPEWSLDWNVGDETIASVSLTVGEVWSFDLEGLEHGETDLRLIVNHVDHPDFTSLPLPVHVVETHELEPEGVQLLVDGAVVASQVEGVVAGELEVHEGDSIDVAVTFLDEKGDPIDPAEIEEGAELIVAVADSMVAEPISVMPRGDAWGFTLVGIEHGETTLDVKILHEGHFDFESLGFPVHVEKEGHELESEGVQLLVDGAVAASQVEGVVTGELEVHEGDSIDVAVTFLDEKGDPIDPAEIEEGAELIVAVADSMVAEPISVTPRGDAWGFTLVGIAHGETTLDVKILHEGHFDFESLEFPVHVEEEHKLEPEGVQFLVDGAVVASQVEGVVTGSLDLDASGSIDVTVTFLDENGDPIDPAEIEEGAELIVTVDDTSVAEAVSVMPRGVAWGFTLVGNASGASTLDVKILHEGHFDFESLPFPVNVIGVVEPEAAMVLDQCNPLAFWNYDPDEGPNEASGLIVVEAGTTRSSLAVQFLHGWFPGRGEFGDDERDVLYLPEGRFELEAVVADEGLATASPTAGQHLRFDLQGLSTGATTIEFRLRDDGSVIYTTGVVDVVVVDPGSATDPNPDFLFKVNGIWTVMLIDGAISTNGCGRTPPGVFELDDGELTALYTLRFLDVDGETCDQNSLSTSQYRIAFDFEDDCIARVVKHPIHWGERLVFHFQGLTAGETNVHAYLLRGDELVFKTPPMPVRINAVVP